MVPYIGLPFWPTSICQVAWDVTWALGASTCGGLGASGKNIKSEPWKQGETRENMVYDGFIWFYMVLYGLWWFYNGFMMFYDVLWWVYDGLWWFSDWWCNNHLEKYEFVNGKDYPIYEMENKKCLKPPTRLGFCSLLRGFHVRCCLKESPVNIFIIFNVLI